LLFECYMTLRVVKFWLINAQSGGQFLMNDTYINTEFERIQYGVTRCVWPKQRPGLDSHIHAKLK